jgi:hypothetical protein
MFHSQDQVSVHQEEIKDQQQKAGPENTLDRIENTDTNSSSIVAYILLYLESGADRIENPEARSISVFYHSNGFLLVPQFLL